MKRAATAMLTLMVALAGSAALSVPAHAALRSPQVAVLGGSLQAYFTSVAQTINVNTDQDATQVWAHTSSNTTTYTLQLESTPNANVNDFGIYNASDAVPVLDLLIAGPITVQGFSTATFKPGNVLVVNRFDALANLLGSQTFNGLDPNGFAFYLKGPNGTFFTQDARNPGAKAQALAYAATGSSAGTWWLCWEENSVAAGSDQDYDDCVILMESVNPTPVSRATWGQVKARFR